jgi:hypothetical protein
MNKYFLLVVLIFSGCTNIPSYKPQSVDVDTRSEKRVLMLGKFYGEHTTADGNYRPWIMERFDDGKYKVIFREYSTETEYVDKVEVGIWGISDPVYFSIYMGTIENGLIYEADMHHAGNYDAYQIIELNKALLKYKSYASNNIYIIKKVTDDFEFPKRKSEKSY